MKFIVKDESLQRFFDTTKDNDTRLSTTFSLLKDEIVIPKTKELEGVTVVIFDLSDQSRKFGAELQSVYEYTVSEYDSMSLKLTIKNREIKSV